MTKPTQDKETLREAVARAIAGSVVKVSVEQVDGELTEPVRMSLIENLAINYYPEADAAIATMFERLRTPSEGMIEAGPLCKEAADTIEAQATRIEALEADNAWMKREYDELSKSAGNKVAAQQSRIEALEAALRNMVNEYVCNVDSYRTGGFYSDPRKDDCVINAEAALEGSGND